MFWPIGEATQVLIPKCDLTQSLQRAVRVGGEGAQGPQEGKEALQEGRLGGISGQHGLAHLLPIPPHTHPDWKSDRLMMATRPCWLGICCSQASFTSLGS